jgi:hypothetical protein
VIVIEYNGSKWAGSQPDPLCALLDMLATHPLDRVFEKYGCFFTDTRASKFGGYGEDGKEIWIDLGLIYPEHPHAVRFWGNFFTYSHGFQIDTDDAEVIEVLLGAIEANRQRPDYLAQGA